MEGYLAPGLVQGEDLLVLGCGLTHYNRTFWDTAVNNKELNLRSQQPMLSHCSCEESVRIPLSHIKVGLKGQVSSEADQTYENASEL